MIEELRKDGGEIRRLSKQEPSPLAKIATGAEPDRLKLMFLPLMNSTKSVSEQTKAAIKLSKQSNLPGEQLISLISAIIVLADKILTKEDINDIWEEIEDAVDQRTSRGWELSTQTPRSGESFYSRN